MPCSPRTAKWGATASVWALAVVLGAAVPVAPADEPARPARSRPVEEPVTAATPSHRHRVVSKFEVGAGPRSYWLFEPAEPRPERAPVVVFLHGWFAVNPAFYGAWIDHLVRSGQIVVFPRYQNDISTPPKDFLPNTAAAIRDAINVLESSPKHVHPDHKRVTFLGHSAGGNLAAQLAAAASNADSGLPLPRLVVAMMPGEVIPSREPALDRISAESLLLVIVGEEDLLVGDLRGRQIFTQATGVPRSRKRYMLFRSDRHGFPPIVAEHTAPTGSNRSLDTGEGVFRSFQMNLGEVNALDRAGFWRMADLAMQAAYQGLTFDGAIGDEVAFTNLGYWSDGRKVTPPLIADDLASMPRVALPNGVRLIPWDISTRAAVNADTDGKVRR